MLEKIKKPEDIKKIPDNELPLLAQEIREKIVSTVAKNGGHLAPSLGVVELTIALLEEFDLNRDKLIWDVGHQAYAHKILTGRSDDFATLRKLGGISGFPRLEESPYDHFGVGHSSTSISAALGMALARDLESEKNHVIAVIGDGSLTGGEAFEGLNLAGHMGRRLIVVLNDNEMAISPNVGALSLFLSRTLSSRWVRQARREVLKFLRSIPRIGQKLAVYAMRGEWSFKSFFTPGMLFEAFRFTYIGPIDGHDIPAIRRHLQQAAAVEDGPVLVHVRTRKGKGYWPAERNPVLFHGVGHFSPETGEQEKSGSAPSFTQIFSRSLVELAEKDNRVIAITAAMPEGTGTDAFRKRFPERFVDTGICEQHAVTFAAGLASQNYRPFLAIYSTFLQRAYDQIVHDVCLQKLPVVFCIDRAGLVGEDGATHHGAFDIAYLRHIPNMRIMAPRDENQLKHALATALSQNMPCAIRYPRGAGFGVKVEEDFKILPLNRGEILQKGEVLLIMAAGSQIYPALKASEIIFRKTGIKPTVFDPVWIKPLPDKQIEDLAAAHKLILVVEEGSAKGGFSSAVLECLGDKDLLVNRKIRRIGLPDEFVQHGTQDELRELSGLGEKGIAESAIKFIEEQGQVRNRG